MISWGRVAQGPEFHKRPFNSKFYFQEMPQRVCSACVHDVSLRRDCVMKENDAKLKISGSQIIY